ncbi:LacI family DNA-binding transcriptional regulator [Saccharibacillus sp. CPCC 101409]|uniref:LacI family DNA-binding transcriptional regulator n=1 Tax=Saccharibacillus sp. CPCC 101409 TaxID=3058041 RepID=UPI002672DF51|nr:LacI family DNA-binding transcriptional regulator [Saccharibacillus sp. CPCC 101409]MDO3408664.1 LacI family DNA-binding transcriptional regulator [Saccharibacillus sp. CPCC 101409]
MNIKDIAKISGVGISTVSRVLNNSGVVSDATRARVMSVVKQYNYVPNSNARNLKMTQSNTIALMVKGISNPFFANMIKEVERQVHLRGCPLLIQHIEDGVDEIGAAVQLVKEKNLCGVIFMGGTYDHSEEEFKQLTVPFVLTTITTIKEVDPSVFSSVSIDDVHSAYKATNYLISLGHRSICFLARFPLVENTIGNRRLLGYKKALEEHGIPYDPAFVEDCEYAPSFGFAAAKRLMNKNKGATAMFAASDAIAIGVAKAVLSSGLSIPGDMSIVGFDGIEMAEYYHPSLDTISQPGVEMAHVSVETLFDLIAGETANKHIVFESLLVKRGSSRKIN